MAIEYKVISGVYPRFEELVNEHLEDGWQLQGGVSMTIWRDPEGEHPDEETYAQALFRELDDDDEEEYDDDDQDAESRW